MERRRIGLRAMVALTCAILVIGVSAILAVLTDNRSRERIQDEAGRSLSEIAAQMANRLDQSMWARSSEVGLLSRLKPLREAGDAAELRRLLDDFQKTFPTVSWMGFTDPAGRVVAATGGILQGQDISERPVFRNGRDGVFIGDVHDAVLLARLLPNPSGEPMKFVDISMPVRDEAGRKLGVLAAHLSWEWVRQVERSLLAALHGREDLTIHVVAMDKTILLGPKAMLGTPLDLESVRAAQAGRRNGWVVETWPDGRRYLTGYAFGNGYMDYKGLGWTIIARQPLDVAFAAADAQTRETVAAGIVMALVFSALGWFAARKITKPLHRIVKAAERIRDGELNHRIPAVGGAAEIRSLSASLNDLVESLTSQRTALERMEDIAYQDRLTTLPNRRFFEQYLEAATVRGGASGSALTFMYIDLDGFKPVNDRLGHDAGDVVLRQVGIRLASCFRSDDVVARLGGDEFAAVLVGASGAPGGPDAGEMAARVIAAVNEPISVAGTSVRVGCSIGIACWPADGKDIADAMRRADEALYAAKRGGKNRAVVWSADAATEA
ncbi:diguanylate cyclase domain-containing protein [Azospirillum sp. sgz301742]